ncbi:BIG GRAIN 1-like protein E [Tanacetum coccineum]
MSKNILLPSHPKKPFHRRNGSDELDVFEAARYFSGANENIIGTHSNTTQNYFMKPIRRMSLDMPKHKGNSIPLQAMLIDPMMINKEKKSKQPSSPGGKLAHFLNSLFNQTSSKKSKSKTKPTKDEDESPSGWRRKRRSSISHFTSGNTNSTTANTITSDSRSLFSTSTSSGFRTPPAHTPTKPTSYKDQRNYSYLKPPPPQTTKVPINGNLNKIENFNIKSDFIDKKMSSAKGFVEKVKMFEEKQEDIKEYKRFINEDDGDSDSSSDLFELTNCDLGYGSSGLPVYETTRMNSIKRGAPISS